MISTPLIRTCGYHELDEFCDEEITHLISILDTEWTGGDIRPDSIPEENYLILQFNDTDNPRDYGAPTECHLYQLTSWLDEQEELSGLLVHCWAGVSRSTAMACAAYACLLPDLDYRVVMDSVAKNASNPDIWPNELVVAVADDFLGANGEFVAAVDAWKAENSTPFEFD